MIGPRSPLRLLVRAMSLAAALGAGLDEAAAQGAPSMPGGAPALGLGVNHPAFTPGSALVGTLTVANPGAPVAVDAYVGLLFPRDAGPSLGCPGGDAIALWVEGFARTVLSCQSAPPGTLPPVVRNFSVPAAMAAVSVPGVPTFAWPSDAPPGRYVVFAVLTLAGTSIPISTAEVGVTFFSPLPGRSVARQWNEEALAAIRLDLPRPPVHARNLFHLAVGMYDAWVAYDQTRAASPYLVRERPASGGEADREEAISFAAYRILSARYARAVGGAESLARFDALMDWLGYDRDVRATDGDAPAAVGNRIAAAILARGVTDGSNESIDYGDPSYAPVNDPLVVKLPGTAMNDPNRWQPLALDFVVTQNGIALPAQVQTFVGSQWGEVAPFALAGGPPHLDPGPPPRIDGDSRDLYRATFVDNIVKSSQLDPGDGVLLDISPGARGNNSLGANDGTGYAVNPSTGRPYAPNVVKRADWARVIAEFWADGPKSETPPGHWNLIASTATDSLADKRIGGSGPAVGDLEWDVKLYFALNGALHDAAIASWGTKRVYDGVRPISAIRYMAGLGQSSDPSAPPYDPRGLPLAPGLIERITSATTAPGGRHATLAGHEGELALFAWAGNPADPATERLGVRWIRALTWVPYQKSTFVTPAFPGYPSGHSTFSRSAAVVLAAFTGSPYFPGGLSRFSARRDSFLTFERGPSEDVVLQWATYFDAADDAGLSRLYGGIHPFVDDFTGRRMGHRVGLDAMAQAQRYFRGEVPAEP